MTWSLWGVPGTVAALVTWAAAAVIYRTDPERCINRRLAFLLVLEGLWVAGAMGVLFFLESEGAVRTASLVATSANAALPFVYLSFLGSALPTPLVAPFRGRTALWLLAGAAIGAAALVLAVPDLFLSQPYAPGWAPWNFRLVELGENLMFLQGAVYLYGLLAAVSVYTRSACCDTMRRQAFWFAVAFGIRDAYLGTTLILYPVLRPIPFWGELLYNPMEGLAFLVYVVLLSYGVLQAQLFDIEVRLRVAVRRSTLVAVIAGAFFVVTEILEAFVPADGLLVGILAAGSIVLLMLPLQRLTESIMTRVMPVEEPSHLELDRRKLDVYRAALEGALQDGIVTEREEEILARLRDELGISEQEEARIRRELAVRAA